MGTGGRFCGGKYGTVEMATAGAVSATAAEAVSEKGIGLGKDGSTIHRG